MLSLLPLPLLLPFLLLLLLLFLWLLILPLLTLTTKWIPDTYNQSDDPCAALTFHRAMTYDS